MKIILSSLYLLCSALLAVGLLSAQDKTIKYTAAKPTTSIDGKSMFTEYCAVCHGTAGKGDGPAASALKSGPGDLTQLMKQNNGKFPDMLVLNVLQGNETLAAHGNQEMPVWGKVFSHMGNVNMTQMRIHGLVQYVEGMQAK